MLRFSIVSDVQDAPFHDCCVAWPTREVFAAGHTVDRARGVVQSSGFTIYRSLLGFDFTTVCLLCRRDPPRAIAQQRQRKTHRTPMDATRAKPDASTVRVTGSVDKPEIAVTFSVTMSQRPNILTATALKKKGLTAQGWQRTHET